MSPTEPSTQKKPKDKDPEAKAQDRKTFGRVTLWLLLAILLSYIGAQLPLPYRLLAVVAGLAGVGGGITFLVFCIRRKLPVLMHISASATVLICGIFLFTASVQAIFWQATAEFDECIASALTQRSQDQCISDYEDNVFSTIPDMR